MRDAENARALNAFGKMESSGESLVGKTFRPDTMTSSQVKAIGSTDSRLFLYAMKELGYNVSVSEDKDGLEMWTIHSKK